MGIWSSSGIAVLVVSWLAAAPGPGTSYGTVKAEQKISATEGGFGGNLSSGDGLGVSVASLGDLDGDGVGDLAAGASSDDDGGGPFVQTNRGAVWILFLNADGTVKAEQKISDTQGGFAGVLLDNDWFGWSLAGLGDLDGDGVEDLAVGARGDDDLGTDRGAIWILFLDVDGTVKNEHKLTDPAVTGGLGFSVASLGDLDGDGTGDLAVGSPITVDGGVSRGAVWILFLDPDGTVLAKQKIDGSSGGLVGPLPVNGEFGWSLADLGDLDGDGVRDLAVGALGDGDGGFHCGAVWVLFLHPNGTVKAQQKINGVNGGFGGTLDVWDEFGAAVAGLGDLDGDGVLDLAVGAERDSDTGQEKGAVWILFLHPDGTVKAEQKINELEGGFGGTLDPNAYFACGLACLGDLDGDAVPDLAVGNLGDNDGGGGGAKGAVWTLFLVGPDTLPPVISCPSAVVEIDSKQGPPGDIVVFSVSAADAIDPAPSLVCVPPSGSFFPAGTTIVTCTATDASGNQSVRTFPVLVTPAIRQQSF